MADDQGGPPPSKAAEPPSKSAACREPRNGRYRAYFTHYRTGKRYYAADYGYRGWPIG